MESSSTVAGECAPDLEEQIFKLWVRFFPLPRRGFGRRGETLLGTFKTGQAGWVSALENRVLLSVAIPHSVHVSVPALSSKGLHFPIAYVRSPGHNTASSELGGSVNTTGASAPGSGITPQQMRAAYGVSSLNFDGIAGDGTGQTIAILDPGDDAGMVNSTSSSFATSDLAIFDHEYGLPNPPSFIKEGFTDPHFGTPALTTTLPGASTADLEISLDVEWSHVMAPDANILLVEGDPSFDDIFNGVLAIDAAATSMHIVTLSMSFSGPESSDVSSTVNAEQIDAEYFDQPGVVYVASSGDNGAYAEGTTTVSPQFPASSNNVLAVGGTTLAVSGNNYVGETTWGAGSNSGSAGGGGGGISAYEPQPAYQVGKVSELSSLNRTYPDVSLDANPTTGVSVYDSPDEGSGTGWYPGQVGGTSLSAPLMAGLIADADQGRALSSLSQLASSGGAGISAANLKLNPASSDVHTLLYGMGYANSDFHDIVGVSAIGPTTAYAPAVGYDLATGLGSPVANDLVPDLSGTYAIPAVNVAPVNNLYLKALSTTQLGVWVNAATPGSGTPTASDRLAYVGGITDPGGGGNDTLTLDFSGGNFTAAFVNEPPAVTALNPPSSGPAINFTGAGANNSLVIVGTTGNDTVTATATTVALGLGLGNASIGVSNVQTLQFAGGSGGSDVLSINGSPTGGYTVFASTPTGSPNVTLNVSNPGTLVLMTTSERIAGLSLQSGAVLRVTSLGAARTHSNHRVLVIGALNSISDPTFSIAPTAKLDMEDDDLIIHTGSNDPGGYNELAGVQGLVQTGRDGGAWDGNELTSMAAQTQDTSDGLESVQLAPVDNNDLGLPFSSWQVGTANETLGKGDIIVKYTYTGDFNLDGEVTATDVSTLGLNYDGGASTGNEWAFGDTNGDGLLNAQDVAIFGNAFGNGTGSKTADDPTQL